jgi:hypothetical protein
MGLRFGTWNVRGLYTYKAGSLMIVAKGISKYELDLVEVQRSDGTEMAPNQQENVNFLLEGD